MKVIVIYKVPNIAICGELMVSTHLLLEKKKHWLYWWVSAGGAVYHVNVLNRMQIIVNNYCDLYIYTQLSA